jgi:hypothetical protein
MGHLLLGQVQALGEYQSITKPSKKFIKKHSMHRLDPIT